MTTAAGPKGVLRLSSLRPELAVWLVLIGAFLWRVWSVYRAVPAAQVFHDTDFYLSAAADNGYFSPGLWAGGRSPLTLFVFKCCHSEPERVRHFFLVSSALSWLALALAVARTASSRGVGLLGAALVLWLAVSRDVLSWNHAVLSESLSFSTGALFAACALSFLRKPRPWFAPFVLSALLFALSRDSNAYLVLFSGLLWGVNAVREGLRRKSYLDSALIGGAFLAIFLVSNASSNHGERWTYPLTNVIVWRVLPEPTVREQFVALGMPASRALRAGRPRRAYDSDRQLSSFRDWVDTHGKSAYIRYLLGNPRYALAAPLGDTSTLFGERMGRYAPKGIEAAGLWPSDLIWLRSWWSVRFAAVLALGGFVLLRGRSGHSPFAIIGLALALLTYPHAFIVWHGDSMEVGRHGLMVALQVELAVLCLLLAAAEAALSLAKRSVQAG